MDALTTFWQKHTAQTSVTGLTAVGGHSDCLLPRIWLPAKRLIESSRRSFVKLCFY